MAEFLTETTYSDTSDLQKAQTAQQALDEIQTERFYNTLKSYYSYRNNDPTFLNKNAADLLEYFYEDRSWRNNNTISMGFDLASVANETNPERIKEFSYIQQTYSALPSFWNDPNRSFGGWLIDNGGAMLSDPINLIGVGVGGQAAKQSFKLGLKELLKGKMANEINKAALEEMTKQASKAALGQAVKKGALYEGYFGAIASGTQDMLLQNIAVKADIQKEVDLKQTALSTAAGFGLGTAFGSAFTAGAFKLTNRTLKNTAVKQLADIHEYGQSNITGKQLFKELSVPKTKQELYQFKPEKTKEQIKIEEEMSAAFNGDTFNNRFLKFKPEPITGGDKPPKIPINVTRYKRGAYQLLIKQRAKELKNKIDSGETISLDEMVEIAGKRMIEMGGDPNVVRNELRKLANNPQTKEQFAFRVIAGDLLAKDAAELVEISNEYSKVDLSAKRKLEIEKQFDSMLESLDELIQITSDLGTAAARSTTAGRIIKDKTRVAQLIAQPEDPRMVKLKTGDKKKFIEAIGKLDDDEQVILALQDVKKANKWDLAAEYVNNNLLSSPDTHEINLISGLIQSQWKPFVMLLRAGNMLTTDKQRALVIAREALQTYIYQYIYIGHALKSAGKTLIKGRATLDSAQMKFDSNIRQGQLQKFISEMGKTISEPIAELGAKISNDAIGKVAGKLVQAPFEVAGLVTTLPLRVLAAGDEFMKTMAFKARLTSIINSEIMKNNPDYGIYLKGKLFTQDYKNKFKEIEKRFVNEKGVANAIGTTVDETLNAPLQYARELSFTQSAYSTNPVTGEEEGAITGWVLQQTQGKGRVARVLGLHFINTPSNLLRWNFQHLPLLGRYQFQMRHMLAEAEDVIDGKIKHVSRKTFAGATSLKSGLSASKKNYLNPEAAAEANARIQAGWLIWATAFSLVSAGRFTGGGSNDWRENQAREDLTGWKPYSYKTADGRYIQFNRLDPVMTPIFIMADIFETMDKSNGVLSPQEQSYVHELAMGTVLGITRNFTSKFYTKNIVDTYQAFFGGGLASSRKPEQRIEASLAKGMYKFLPLSGGVRYVDRITDEYEKDLWTLSDRLQRYFKDNPQEKVMPKRNAWGEKIKTKRAWLFGIGGQEGVISSPFSMSDYKSDATSKFFNERSDINYRPPSAVAKRITGQDVDLKTLRKEDGQTAYDRWLEIKSEIKLNQFGAVTKKDGVSLKEFIENQIKDKNSALNRNLIKGITNGIDYQQRYILSVIHSVESVAYNMMAQEFPILATIEESEMSLLKEAFKQQKTLNKSAIDILSQ